MKKFNKNPIDYNKENDFFSLRTNESTFRKPFVNKIYLGKIGCWYIISRNLKSTEDKIFQT